MYVPLGWTANLENPMAGSVWAPGKLALAFYGGLWSYAGWDILNYGTPEIAKPTRWVKVDMLSVCSIIEWRAYRHRILRVQNDFP